MKPGDIPKKLEFGNPEHIKLRKMTEPKEYVRCKKDISGDLVSICCPFCQTEITEIAQANKLDGWIQWAGCPNPKCQDNPNNPDYGKTELWSGTTDLDGKLLDW